jgi:hypothetical protein
MMVEIREFITVFDPEAIQVLASALDDAWAGFKNPAADLLGLLTRVQCERFLPNE